MKKKIPLEEKFYRLRELSKQVQSVGFLIRSSDPAISWSENECIGIAGILEPLSLRISGLAEKIETELNEPKSSTP